MMTKSASNALVQHVKTTLADQLPFWLVPTLVIGTLGSVYAIVKPSTWRASQALIIRDQVVGELSASGRFSNSDARKSAQETVIQVARNRNVVRNALQQVGPRTPRTSEWPSEADIQALQDRIAVLAPKGAEFGQSDVIYLLVDGRTSERSIELNRAVFGQLQQRLQLLRNRRAESVIRELTEKVNLTQANLDESTSQLEAMEREVGSDLGELRTLNQTGSGESNLRTALTQIKNDLRASESSRTTLQQQLQFLLAAAEDPATLVATPSGLLESQPALRRLKDGLIDAQLRVAELMGNMNPTHPAVKAAMTAEAEVRQHLHGELSTAIRGARAELNVTVAVIDSLELQLSAVQQRLDHLASLRARYENLVSDVRHRGEQVKETQRALADARASREASATSSLLTRVDEPDAGDGPLGPRRVVIVLASWLGGFLTGIGILCLNVAPAAQGSGRRRRWSDRLGAAFGRRATDPPATAQPGSVVSTGGRRAADRSSSATDDPAPDQSRDDRRSSLSG